MKNLTLPLGIFILAVAAGIAIMLLPGKSSAPTTNQNQNSTTTVQQTDPHADLIVVDKPTKGATISSPITIIGSARGSWYFEASFPVQILDANGAVIAQGPAQAQSDWMTPNFVSFTATLSFLPQPVGSKGTIVLKKDNPSGEASRDDSITIPIVF